MSFILKDNPVVVNIKLTNEGRKKLASGEFNVTKFAVGDSEINYKFYNEINFDKNNSIVLSPKDNLKDIKYKVKRFFNSTETEYSTVALSSRRETKIDLNLGFFNGDSIYEMKADLNSSIVKFSQLRIDLGDLNPVNPRLLRIRQDSTFVFVNEPEVGDYILVNWSNFINNSDNFRNGIIDYNKYSPFIWYKIVSITGSLENNTLSVTVDRDLPEFQIFQADNFYSNCLIYPKYNSIINFYGTQNLSDFWNFSDDDYIENILQNALITPIFNLTLFYPDNNTGFLSNYIKPNNLQSYQYAGFLEFISEYNKNKNEIYGIVHYTNTTPHNTIGESFYKNTAEILLPTIMWYKNKDNKQGLILKCGNDIKRVTNHNIYYYDLIDDNNFIVGKCFHELKIFLIEDQELLSAMSFKSNRNWTLPPSLLTINDFVCPPEDPTTTTTTTVPPTTTSTTTVPQFSPFVSTWETTNTSTGSSDSNQIKLPLKSNGNYNFIVDWGDGNTDTITTWDQVETTHTYSSPGEYTITITGICSGFAFENTGDRQKLLNIISFGDINFGNYSNGIFSGCSNLNLPTVIDVPKLSTIITLSRMFEDCNNLTNVNNMNSWNVSTVINMGFMFNNTQFNQPIGNWDVSNVTNMISMFRDSQFNQPIGNWDVSNVTNMISMFRNSPFNQPIGDWDVSNVTSMNTMFWESPFNQPIGNWDVGNVTDMGFMFANTPFNQPIGNWDVSKVTNMQVMFRDSQFNQPIGNWDVSNVTNMISMFRNSPFNQPIGDWNVSNVTSMSTMFQESQFNQPIGNWDVSSVTNMQSMFSGSTAFNQNIGNWNVSNVAVFSFFMLGKSSANFTPTNLDAIYNGWSSLTLQPNININFGTIKYTAAGQAGRDILTNAPNNWTISDGGIE